MGPSAEAVTATWTWPGPVIDAVPAAPEREITVCAALTAAARRVRSSAPAA